MQNRNRYFVEQLLVAVSGFFTKTVTMTLHRIWDHSRKMTETLCTQISKVSVLKIFLKNSWFFGSYWLFKRWQTLLVTTVIHKYGGWNWNERCYVSSASKEFNVDKKSIREWRKSKDKFLSLRKKHRGAKRKRLNGAGRKPIDQQMIYT